MKLAKWLINNRTNKYGLTISIGANPLLNIPQWAFLSSPTYGNTILISCIDV